MSDDRLARKIAARRRARVNVPPPPAPALCPGCQAVDGAGRPTACQQGCPITYVQIPRAEGGYCEHCNWRGRGPCIEHGPPRVRIRLQGDMPRTMLKKKVKRSGWEDAVASGRAADVVRADPPASSDPEGDYMRLANALMHGPRYVPGAQVPAQPQRDEVVQPVPKVAEVEDEDEDDTPAPARSGKGLADGLTAEEREAVDWYVRKQHPDWFPGK